jgi:hemoglobin
MTAHSERKQSLFEYAGGEEALHRLEQIFYDSVLADPLLAPLFGGGKPTHVEHLTMFTTESFGGPDRFTRELGFQHLIDVHRGLRITEAQRQRFVELYLAALDKADMPSDPAFREAFREHIEFGSHVAMQNSHAKPMTNCTPFAKSHTGHGRERAANVDLFLCGTSDDPG